MKTAPCCLSRTHHPTPSPERCLWRAAHPLSAQLSGGHDVRVRASAAPSRSVADRLGPRLPAPSRLQLRLGVALVLAAWAGAAGGQEEGAVAAVVEGSPESSARPSLVERWAQPPAAGRIAKIIHNWPDAPQAQDALIERLVAQGFGGVVCNVHSDQYLESEAKWAAFGRAVRAARAAGLALWLYDERGYPSANAGGLVLRDHPEWQARGLLIAEVEGGGEVVSLAVPPGEPFLRAAFPVLAGEIQLEGKVELSDRVVAGRLSWQPPAGRWRVLAISESPLYEGTHAELNLHAKLPYPNLLLPEPTARFLELTHDRYARHLGENLGQWFVSTFTDEPSLMSVFLRRMPYRVLPWAQNLAAEFKQRRGYALEPFVPALVAEAGAAGRKARHDYWRTVGELVSQNFFGQIQQWCARHQIPSGGHLLAEENLSAHVPLYGDFFQCVRRLDVPSIDCLTSLPPEVPWHIARLVSSAAEVEGKSLVMSETSDHAQRWRAAGDARPVRNVTEAEIRGTCNRLFVSGVNRITSYYSYAGLSDDQVQRLNQWVGRCATLLTGGHQVADVAVVYPVESLWLRFFPSRLWAQEASEAVRVENVFRSVADGLFAARRDVTFVDGQALCQARPENGTLAHGSLRWRVIVLPMADTLPLAAWENLAAFVRQGGVLVAVGALPAHSEREFPAPRVQALARELWGEPGDRPWVTANGADGAGIYLPEGAAGLLPGLLDRVLEPDVRGVDRRAPLRVTHRRIDNHEVYFLINDSAEPWSGQVELSVSGPGEQWNLATGQVAALAAGSRCRIHLDAYGATLLRFPAARPGHRRPLRTGALPSLKLEELPVTDVALAGGEFVRHEWSAAGPPGPSAGSTRGWHARATLTKSHVDTFLFVRLAHPPGYDLSGADLLVFESVVPAGQRTPTQLLVILREADGSDYLASTGRALSAPGHSQTFLSLSRFQVAGWSQDENGRLDPATVSEIRIGWGGYLGAQDEVVEFSLLNLRCGREP